MGRVAPQEQGQIKEDFLALAGRDAVLELVLFEVASVPIETGQVFQVDHDCILLQYTNGSKAGVTLLWKEGVCYTDNMVIPAFAAG